jgi:hypothetical protein
LRRRIDPAALHEFAHLGIDDRARSSHVRTPRGAHSSNDEDLRIGEERRIM